MQIQRLNQVKDKIFEKSQSVVDLNAKMKYLFKTMGMINKLDYWTKLFAKFKYCREIDPWYPVPNLENESLVLKEITNPDVAPNQIQIIIEPNAFCMGKKLSVKIGFKGLEQELPAEIIDIGKQAKIVRNIDFTGKEALIQKLCDRRVSI